MKKTIVLGLLLLGAMTTVVRAGSPLDAYSRRGKAEIYGFGQSISSGGDTTFGNGALSLKFKSGFGGGAGLGFNVIDYLNINTEFSGAGLDIEGNALGISVPGSTSVFNWNVSLDLNILKTRLTPLITAGVGLMHFSGDFKVEGSEFKETDFSYGVGGGVRWDFTDHWFVKAVYRANWTNLENSDSATLFHTGADFSRGRGGIAPHMRYAFGIPRQGFQRRRMSDAMPQRQHTS